MLCEWARISMERAILNPYVRTCSNWSRNWSVLFLVVGLATVLNYFKEKLNIAYCFSDEAGIKKKDICWRRFHYFSNCIFHSVLSELHSANWPQYQKIQTQGYKSFSGWLTKKVTTLKANHLNIVRTSWKMDSKSLNLNLWKKKFKKSALTAFSWEWFLDAKFCYTFWPRKLIQNQSWQYWFSIYCKFEIDFFTPI